MAPLAKALGLNTLTVFGGVGQNPQIRASGTASTSSSPAPAASRTSCSRATSSSTGSRSPSSTRPTTWPTSASCPACAGSWRRRPRDGQRLLFSATLDAGDQRPRQALPHQSGDAQADSAQSPVVDDGPPRAARRCRRAPAGAARPDRGPGPHRRLHPHQAPGQEADQAAQRLAACRRSSCTATSARAPAPATWTASPTAAPRRSSRPTSPPAASTSTTSALVIHADPPVEHKAYLHRSGRTARAGNDGTVVTMMPDEQVRDVRDLTRKAGIKPTTTRVQLGHPLLTELAPGDRSYAGGLVREARSGRLGSTARAAGGAGRGRGRAAAAAVRSAGGWRRCRSRGRRGRRRSGRGARVAAARVGAARARPVVVRSGGRSPSGGSGSGGGSGRRGGTSTVYSTSSGGSAASFSAGSRAGARRSR